jgi:hypothetical protein
MQKSYVEHWKVQEVCEAIITRASGEEQEEEELPSTKNYKRKQLQQK